MQKQKLIKKTFNLTARMLEMVEELQSKKGLPDFTSVMQYALAEIHGREFRDYSARKGGGDGAADPEERKAKAKQRQADVEVERLKDIAKRLGGELSLSGNTTMVEYFTYSKTGRYKQRMPLDHLTEEMVQNQYFPSKEAVEQAQKEGKTDYKVS